LNIVDYLIYESIEFIKRYAPKDGYVVNFSGGKDSVVLLDLVKKAGVPYKAVYLNPTIDPPELVHFVRRAYPEVTIMQPSIPFFKMVQRKGLPTRTLRWCCNIYKETRGAKLGKHHLLGIRCEESPKRAKRQRISQHQGVTHYYPIFYWRTIDIWTYIKQNQLPYCKLYDEGFRRLGCVICPMQNHKEFLRNQKLYPHHFQALKRAFKVFYDNHPAVQERGEFESLWQYWLKYHMLPGKKYRNIKGGKL